MKSQHNKEDRDIITQGEMLRSLVESDGWKVAKTMLDGRIDQVKFVSTLDTKQPIEEIGKEAFARAVAINLIQTWFNDIQARIEQYYEEINPNEEPEDDIIKEQ